MFLYSGFKKEITIFFLCLVYLLYLFSFVSASDSRAAVTSYLILECFTDYGTSPYFFHQHFLKYCVNSSFKKHSVTLHSVMQSSKPVTDTSVWVKCCCQNCLFDSTLVFMAAVASDWSDSASLPRDHLTFSKCKKKPKTFPVLLNHQINLKMTGSLVRKYTWRVFFSLRSGSEILFILSRDTSESEAGSARASHVRLVTTRPVNNNYNNNNNPLK